MTSSQPMKKNTATKIVFPILDADGDLVSSAASLDSEYSLDGGAFSDCASEATEIGSTGIYYLNLAAGETNGDVICIQVKTSTSGAKTTVLVFYTAAQTLDEVKTETAAIKAKTDIIGASVALESGGNLAAVKAKTDNLPADPADESLLEAEINANEAKIDILDGLIDDIVTKIGDPDPFTISDWVSMTYNELHDTTNVNLNDVLTRIGEPAPDTLAVLIAAVKAKTDLLAFTGGNVHAHIKAKDNLNLTALEKADINAEVDSALDTAIPGAPTADSINARLVASHKILKNRWKIDSVAKTLTFYDDDEATPLFVFNLKDSAGNPATADVYDRDPA